MSEPVCVCGHTREQHHKNVGTGCMMDECWKPDNRCLAFRPSLPWPDSISLWWIQTRHGVHPVNHQMPGSAVCDGKEFLLAFDGKLYSRAQFEKTYGPASFTKVLEKNPYEESQA